LLIAILAMGGVAVLSVTTNLLPHDGDVTAYLRVGTYGASRPYIERSFPHPLLTGDLGHDGQQYYVIASTFPHLDTAAPYVDRVRYRSRRILFPLLVAPFPDGPARVWAMFGVNLLAVGACAIAFSKLAERLGVTPWFGLVAIATPALIESTNGSLGDGLAVALALWGVVLWRRQLAVAIALFALAALTRETTLVVPLACFVVADRRARLALLAVPVIFGAWALSVMAWLPDTGSGGTSIFTEARQQLDVPFKALLDLGITEPGPLLAVMLIVASIIGALQLRHRLPELAWWLVFDAVLVALSNRGVVERPFNIARVAPLAFAALVLVVLARNQRVAPRVAGAAG
jgi:hypothetical protein